MDKLDTIQRMMIIVRGACAGEVVLNERCNDVIDNIPVDLSDDFDFGGRKGQTGWVLDNMYRIHFLGKEKLVYYNKLT